MPRARRAKSRSRSRSRTRRGKKSACKGKTVVPGHTAVIAGKRVHVKRYCRKKTNAVHVGGHRKSKAKAPRAAGRRKAGGRRISRRTPPRDSRGRFVSRKR